MALIDDIRLSLIPMDSKTKLHLLSLFGTAANIFKVSKEELSERALLSARQIPQILDARYSYNAEEEMAFVDKYSIRTLVYGNDDFPSSVAATEDSPSLLFAKGNIDFNESDKWISIVGTRKATNQGVLNCGQIVEEIAERFPSAVIVSGLAMGIDIVAHKAAISCGLKSVAVVAHGLSTIYPSHHRQWAKKMIDEGGAVVTEFASGVGPLRFNFPRRNRIIASLSSATIVVEASAKGGSLITADIADSYDREVFACPGQFHDKNYVGCNRLIKTSKASLYQSASDLNYIMGWEDEAFSDRFPISLNEDERGVYEQMGDEAITAEELAHRCELPIYAIYSALTSMEVNGIVKSVKARMYIKLK